MTVIEGNPVEVIADEGMILTDGETYSEHVYLGIYDAPENWREVPKEEGGTYEP